MDSLDVSFKKFIPSANREWNDLTMPFARLQQSQCPVNNMGKLLGHGLFMNQAPTTLRKRFEPCCKYDEPAGELSCLYPWNTFHLYQSSTELSSMGVVHEWRWCGRWIAQDSKGQGIADWVGLTLASCYVGVELPVGLLSCLQSIDNARIGHT